MWSVQLVVSNYSTQIYDYIWRVVPTMITSIVTYIRAFFHCLLLTVRLPPLGALLNAATLNGCEQHHPPRVWHLYTSKQFKVNFNTSFCFPCHCKSLHMPFPFQAHRYFPTDCPPCLAKNSFPKGTLISMTCSDNSYFTWSTPSLLPSCNHPTKVQRNTWV